MEVLDRQRVRSSFNRHAGEYEVHADVQKRVVKRLVDLLKGEALAPAAVLDIGTGTGLLLRALAGLYPAARLAGLDLAVGMCLTARAATGGTAGIAFLAGDAERLPLRDASFDLAVSSSTFQWLEDPLIAFSEAFRVLRPGGLFAFALFGERTLFELRSSYRQAYEAVRHAPETRTRTFLAPAGVEASLAEAGFAVGHCGSELEVERHPDVPELLKAIRGVGAGNPRPVGSRGLAERRVMLAMMDTYRREYGEGGMIPATYEVVYGVARKPEGAPAGR